MFQCYGLCNLYGIIDVFITLTDVSMNISVFTARDWLGAPISGLILGLHPANERRFYKVTPSLIGWAQTLNQPWICMLFFVISESIRFSFTSMCVLVPINFEKYVVKCKLSTCNQLFSTHSDFYKVLSGISLRSELCLQVKFKKSREEILGSMSSV